MLSRIAVICLCFWTGACAVGVQHRYDTTDANIDVTTKHRVAVAVQDARPYVLSGEEQANFVGYSRGGYYNSFDVTTTTDRPLAHDMTQSIVFALKAGGATATGVNLPASSDAAAARSTLLSAKADRYVWLLLQEWKSNTYIRTSLHYNIVLRILGADGAVRGKKLLSGRESLGGNAMNPPGHSRAAIPKAFRGKIEELFSDPGIIHALK